MASGPGRVMAVSGAVTAVVHVAHAGLVIGGAIIVLAMLSPLAIRRRRTALADLREAAASGNLVRLAELRAAGHVESGHTVDRRRPALVVAVIGSLIAAGVHAAVCPEHFREGLRFGVFFILASLWQTGWSILVVRRPTQLLFTLGLLTNAAMIVLWSLTRTVGLPFGLADVESVGVVDLIATIAEVATVIGCIACSEWAGRLRPEVAVAREGA